MQRLRRQLARLVGNNRTTADAFWALLGAVVGRALLLVSLLLCTRILGQENFGRFGLVQSAIVALQGLLFYGLGLTASKFVAELRDNAPDRAGRVIALSLLVSIVAGSVFGAGLFLLTPWYTGSFLGHPELGGPVRISTVAILIGSILGAINGALAGLGAFRLQAFINILSGMTQAAALPLGAVLGGVEGAVWGLTVSTGLNVAAGIITLRMSASKYRISLWPRRAFSEWRILANFSAPAVAASALMSPVPWVTYSILATHKVGLEHLALVTIATQWRSFVHFIPQKLSPVFTTSMAAALARGPHGDFARTVRTSAIVSGLAALLLASTAIIASPWILPLYGAQFKGAQAAFSAFLAGGVLIALDYSLNRGLAAVDKISTVFVSTVAWAIVAVALSYALIPSFLSLGLAIAFGAAYGVRLLLEVAELNRQIRRLSLRNQSANNGATVIPQLNTLTEHTR